MFALCVDHSQGIDRANVAGRNQAVAHHIVDPILEHDDAVTVELECFWCDFDAIAKPDAKKPVDSDCEVPNFSFDRVLHRTPGC